MKWPQKVKWIRKSLGLQQNQLARVLNVSPATICRWEKEDLLPEGGNQQLVEALYIRAQEKRSEELRNIGNDILKGIAVGAAIAGFVLLLGALFKE